MVLLFKSDTSIGMCTHKHVHRCTCPLAQLFPEVARLELILTSNPSSLLTGLYLQIPPNQFAWHSAVIPKHSQSSEN